MLKSQQLGQLSLPHIPIYKKRNITKNENPLSRVSPVQYSPSQCVMEGDSGEQVGGELESVTSSVGCFMQG